MATRETQTDEGNVWPNLHLDEIWQSFWSVLLLFLWKGFEHFTHWSNSVFHIYMCALLQTGNGWLCVCIVHTLCIGFSSIFFVSKIASALPLSGITWHMIFFPLISKCVNKKSFFFPRSHIHTWMLTHSECWLSVTTLSPGGGKKKKHCGFVQVLLSRLVKVSPKVEISWSDVIHWGLWTHRPFFLFDSFKNCECLTGLSGSCGFTSEVQVNKHPLASFRRLWKH